MDAKLTLKLDQQTIEQAKLFAAKHRISLSHLIEQYLQSPLAQECPRSETSRHPMHQGMNNVRVFLPRWRKNVRGRK